MYELGGGRGGTEWEDRKSSGRKQLARELMLWGHQERDEGSRQGWE